MRVRYYRDVEPVQERPGVTKRDVIASDDGAPNFCMRVFDVEPGSSTPFHEHPWEHEVYVLSGRGVVMSEKGETPIGPDSVIFIAPHEHHCLVNKGDEPLRFVCLIPIVK